MALTGGPKVAPVGMLEIAQALIRQIPDYPQEGRVQSPEVQKYYTQGYAMIALKDTGASRAEGLCNGIIGLYDLTEQKVLDVLESRGDDFCCSMWDEETETGGVCWLLGCNTWVGQGMERSAAPLLVKVSSAGAEGPVFMERITALPDAARTCGVELPEDEVFFDGASDYWADHRVEPEQYGFVLWMRTPGWTPDMGAETQWTMVGRVPLTEMEVTATCYLDVVEAGAEKVDGSREYTLYQSVVAAPSGLAAL